MENLTFKTERMEFIAATEAMVQAEISDRAAFEALLGARVPAAWPPEFNDLETMTFILRHLQGQPEQVGWWSWYFVLQGPETERVLIGNGGFLGPPEAGVGVEIGYSLLKQYQRKGYGTEAVQGLLVWAFAQGVRRVTAETLPELRGSIRVLEKNGFLFVGEGSEPGVIRYEKIMA